MNKIKVTERAVQQRINRRWRRDNKVMRKTREGTRARHELGEFYVLDFNTDVGGGIPWPDNIDMEGTAREMGLLKEYEEVV